ncbi:hypothetical protein ARAM_007328 [Aspergillus rambellii]|uniref:SnoaL-like domain-containing protein n=1 Tax=Aspergillus rambellii TaxID=308745 RepID=A0A0F8WK91_9EURO|nr:hypothetical protein ARAM_007328 [Aspergillus rambellii]
MESFYRTSDTEALHDQYVASFTNDATLIMGPKTARGEDEIRSLRHGLWTHVANRKHFPTRIFFGAANELMLYGTVRYMLRLRRKPRSRFRGPAGLCLMSSGS